MVFIWNQKDSFQSWMRMEHLGIYSRTCFWTKKYSKAFKNQFVIPEFPDLCSIIREIYGECKNIDNGKVASYIPQLSICIVDGQR